jgi:hypothetical protein
MNIVADLNDWSFFGRSSYSVLKRLFISGKSIQKGKLFFDQKIPSLENLII